MCLKTGPEFCGMRDRVTCEIEFRGFLNRGGSLSQNPPVRCVAEYDLRDANAEALSARLDRSRTARVLDKGRGPNGSVDDPFYVLCNTGHLGPRPTAPFLDVASLTALNTDCSEDAQLLACSYQAARNLRVPMDLLHILEVMDEQ